MSASGDRAPDGSGVVSVVSVMGNPAAGSDWQTNPPSVRQLIAVTAVLVTSATVASRLPQLQLKDNAGHLLVALPSSSAQAASLTETYVWGCNLPFASGSNLNLTPIPSGIVLPVTATIGTSTAALQAGDQWQSIVLTYAG